MLGSRAASMDCIPPGEACIEVFRCLFNYQGAKMRAVIVAGVMVAGLAFAGTAGASADLAKSSGCMNCHAVDAKKVGPGFKDVAAKHKGKGDEAAVAAKISGAKDHPKVKANEEDVKKLVTWVMSL